MASTGMSVLILADGSYADANRIIAAGIDGYIIRDTASATVMKVPKLSGTYNLADGSVKPDDDKNMYTNDLSSEKEAYRRLQGVSGIANCLDICANGLVLEFYTHGDLEDYIQHNSPPPWRQRVNWILQILDALIACHNKRILVFDIALRNFMLDSDLNLKLIDFANSSLLQLDEDTALVDEDGYTAEIDILHATNVIYSISRWEKFQTDCMSMDEWPVADSLPSTSDLPLGDIITKAWSHQFSTLDELKLAVKSAATKTATTGHNESSSLLQKPVFIVVALACAIIRPTMRRLSRAFSRAKETDNEKEANATTIGSTNSPSPPPPTYEEAERQQHNVQHPPDTANSFAQLDPDLPSPEDGIAHLKLLECFYRLKQKIASTDGLFGISSDIVQENDQNTPPKNAHNDQNSMILTLLAEKRWQVYVSRAVDRFSKWRYTMEPDVDYYTFNHAWSFGADLAERVKPEKANPLTFDAANLPPIDVLMVWHSYMLNPMIYLDDCARHGRMRLWHTPFPLQLVADHISDLDYHYETAKETMTGFRGRFNFDWDNLDGSSEMIVGCHSCGAQNTALWTTYGAVFEGPEEFPRWAAENKAVNLKSIESRLSACQGFADKEFALTCQKCNSQITHDSLCVAKLHKDVKLVLEKKVVLPGGIMYKSHGLPSAVGKPIIWSGWEDTMFPSLMMFSGMGERLLKLTGSDMRMASVREVVEECLTDKEMTKDARTDRHRSRMSKEEAIALRRMMSRYWENSSSFGIDLVGAVIRQGSFVEKMHDIDWLHSPALSHTIPRLIRKYSRFIAIIAKHNKLAVPTLDVDLAWHTHQLNSLHYMQYTIAKAKSFIDHDDKVAETKLTDAFAETSKIYQRLYGEPYSECTCWYCEAVRESHTSTASRLFRSNNATASDQLHSTPSDPKKSVHISTHNAVRPTGDKRYDENVTKRIGELEKAYDKACKRADKKGKPRPKRDDYYYSESYGHPVFIPMYAPYYGAMPYTPVIYPVNPGCMALGVGAVGNCCAGTCGAATAAGGFCSGAGSCGSLGGCVSGGISSGGCGSSSGGCGASSNCGGGGGGGGAGCGGGGGGGGGGC
ncbi:hypothetical protein KCU98_g9383, partial [Aureobasidium melanogenum]